MIALPEDHPSAQRRIFVQKRDGRNEVFEPAKIVLSMIRTGVPAGYAQTIAQNIGRAASDGITTREIRIRALRMLMARNPEWVKTCIAAGTLPGREHDAMRWLNTIPMEKDSRC